MDSVAALQIALAAEQQAQAFLKKASDAEKAQLQDEIRSLKKELKEAEVKHEHLQRCIDAHGLWLNRFPEAFPKMLGAAVHDRDSMDEMLQVGTAFKKSDISRAIRYHNISPGLSSVNSSSTHAHHQLSGASAVTLSRLKIATLSTLTIATRKDDT